MPSSTAARLDRVPALLSLVVGVVVVLALLGSGVGSSQAAQVLAERSVPRDADRGSAAETARDEDAGSSTATAALARVDALTIHQPAREIVVAGFHQASTPGSLALEPVGEAARVLPSRGRGYPRTSAVDVVLVDDEPVRAPVSGRVVEVERYALYGRHPDFRVTIEPHDRPDLRVVLLHVARLRVEEGERVAAGETVLARTARRFPFRSQVDDETAPDAWPHVHLEVKATSGAASQR